MFRFRLSLVLVPILALPAAGRGAADNGSATAAPPAPAPAVSATYPLSAFSAIGSSFAQGNHLPELGWNEAQISAFIEGIRAAFRGKPYPFDDPAKEASAAMGRRVQELQSREREAEFAQPGRLRAYMKDMRKRLNLEEADDGLCFGIQTGGKGNRPGPDDTVVLSCLAVAADGVTKLPQLSTERARMKVKDLLPGIAEGVEMMTNTSQALLIVPPALSFGSGEWPEGVDRGTPIIFQVTLHEVVTAGAK
jgi:FKBP-type peptidyl-prolyl cis-trans isomerase FkpA